VKDNIKLKLVPLDSLPPKAYFRHQNQVNSSIWPRDNRKCRFQVAAMLKSNMADIRGEFRVAQYLEMFATCYCICVANLVLVSQNAQFFWILGLNSPTILIMMYGELRLNTTRH